MSSWPATCARRTWSRCTASGPWTGARPLALESHRLIACGLPPDSCWMIAQMSFSLILLVSTPLAWRFIASSIHSLTWPAARDRRTGRPPLGRGRHCRLHHHRRRHHRHHRRTGGVTATSAATASAAATGAAGLGALLVWVCCGAGSGLAFQSMVRPGAGLKGWSPGAGRAENLARCSRHPSPCSARHSARGWRCPPPAARHPWPPRDSGLMAASARRFGLRVRGVPVAYLGEQALAALLHRGLGGLQAPAAVPARRPRCSAPRTPRCRPW